MSDSNRRDRYALIALALILSAVVVVALVEVGLRRHDVADDAVSSHFQYFGDTPAQWLMAVFAVLATAVSWWAVVLVRRTWQEAKRTADAAIEANGTAKRIGEAQVRAYLSCIGASFRLGPNGTFVKIDLKNAGQSPALECTITVKQSVPNLHSAGGRDQIKTGPAFSAAVYSIVSGGQEPAAIFMNMLWLDSLHARKIVSGDLIFALECNAEWVDVFGRRQVLAFHLVEETFQTENGVRVGEMMATNRKAELT